MKKLMKRMTRKDTSYHTPTHTIKVYSDGEVKLETFINDMLNTDVTVQVFLNYCSQSEFYNRSFIIDQADFLEITEKMKHEDIAFIKFKEVDKQIRFVMKDEAVYMIDYLETEFSSKKIEIYTDEPNQFTLHEDDLKDIYKKKVIKSMFKDAKKNGRVSLNCLAFNGSEYACTDIRRLHVHKIQDTQELESPIVIGQAVLELLLDSDGSDKIFGVLKDNRVTMLNGILAIEYTNNYDYPDYKSITPSCDSNTSYLKVQDKKEFIKTIEKLVGDSIILECNEKDKFDISGFSGFGEDMKIKSNISIKKSIVEVTNYIDQIPFNKHYFMEMLEAFDQNNFDIEINGPTRPTQIISGDDHQILMPLRG